MTPSNPRKLEVVISFLEMQSPPERRASHRPARQGRDHPGRKPDSVILSLLI